MSRESDIEKFNRIKARFNPNQDQNINEQDKYKKELNELPGELNYEPNLTKNNFSISFSIKPKDLFFPKKNK